jgi:ubiquinone/menaquinone biosynthesis C-methylase UbiE
LGINLEVLGLQSIPLIAKEIGEEVNFPTDVLSQPLRTEDFQTYLDECRRILNTWVEDSKISWWDVYNYSDIGKERQLVASEMDLSTSEPILDIGCGRGYFSIAAAALSKTVIGVDFMNGHGRVRWWKNFKEAMRELGLSEVVSSAKSNGAQLPFTSHSFHVAAAVHSIRNFQDHRILHQVIKEMKRVVEPSGSVFIIESLPEPHTKAQEAHLLMFKYKVKYTSAELEFLPKKQLVKVFNVIGFKEIVVRELDYNLSAAPPLFCIDYHISSLPEKIRCRALEEYHEAVSMMKRWGEVSPPAVLVQGIV